MSRKTPSTAQGNDSVTFVIEITHETLAEIVRGMLSTVRPPPELTVSEWTEDNRYLSQETTAEAGRYDIGRAEYQRGPMDAISDPEVEEVVLPWASQTGKTEIELSAEGYYMDCDPCPILVVVPTFNDVKSYSKERLAPMIRLTPPLKAKVSEAKSRDGSNTLESKVFPGGRISITASHSPAGLCARPIRVILFDEVDRYPESAGTEGDPVKLGEARTRTFWNKKRIKVSSPTIEGASRIWYDYERSSMERFYVPCPHCKRYQTLEWSCIKFDKDRTDPKNPIILEDTARYVCPRCKKPWTEGQRHAAVSRGKWVAKHPQVKKVRGFHISAIYSPWMTLGEIVKEFKDCCGDPHKLKTFHNTILAILWKEKVETISADPLIARREDYKADPLPLRVGLITAAVDVQHNRLEGEILGWGLNEQTWSLDYFTIWGDPHDDRVWHDLDMWLSTVYTHPSGTRLRIAATAIDSGYAAKYVYDFCNPRFNRRIFPVKGDNTNKHKPILTPPHAKSKGQRVWIVGGGQAKDLLAARLKIVDPKAFGYQHFPKRYGEAHFKQLTAEVKKTVMRNGRPTTAWVLPAGRSNEVLDCRVYNMAAREFLGYSTVRLNQIVEQLMNAKAPQKPKMGRRRPRLTFKRRQ